MDYKSKIVRSKSNSITDSEIRCLNKICKICKGQEQVAKKRGVYVERFSNTVIENERIKKSPIRVRPSEKKFLDSVLTILSKSSNGTQYPEGYLKNNTNTKLNKKFKPKNKPHIAKTNQVKEETLTISAQNHVTHTPLTKSSKVKTKLDLFGLDSTDTIIDMSNTLCNIERLQKEISVGNISNESMSQTTNFDNYNKKVYNICADLLKSTVSVHDDDNITQSPKSLQINVPAVTDQLNNNPQERKNRRYPTQFKTNSSKVNYIDNETKVLKNAKPIGKAQYTNKPLLPKAEKVEMRKGSRKRHKQNFINYLTQQLQMDNCILQEPHSFFDTLKLMVGYKKKAAISHNFRKAEQAFIDSKECTYKNRKVTSKNKYKK